MANPATKEELGLALKLNIVSKKVFIPQEAFRLFSGASKNSRWGGTFVEGLGKLSSIATSATREEAVSLTLKLVGLAPSEPITDAFNRFVDGLLMYYANRKSEESKEALELMNNALQLITSSQALPRENTDNPSS